LFDPHRFCQTNHLFNLLERAAKEIRFSMANGMFKIKMDIDRHGPRSMPDNCKNLNPPYFSLPSTFKVFFDVILTILQYGDVMAYNCRTGSALGILKMAADFPDVAQTLYSSQLAQMPWRL
jgi:hypothetical protein